MKIEIILQKKIFTPVKLLLTLETQQELSTLQNMLANTGIDPEYSKEVREMANTIFSRIEDL